MAAAKDFVRLHPDEASYWSDELCFVNVPVKGQKHNTLHLIDEDLALQFLEAGEIQRFRLALATKPGDVFFLCAGPDAEHRQQLEQCQTWKGAKRPRRFGPRRPAARAKASKATRSPSPRTRTASPEPNWPTQSLGELIVRAFAGRMIETEDHPALVAHDRREAVVIVSKNFATIVVVRLRIRNRSRRTSRTCCAWSRTCWMRTFSTCAPSACGAATSARPRHSTSAPTRCSSPIPRGRR